MQRPVHEGKAMTLNFDLSLEIYLLEPIQAGLEKEASEHDTTLTEHASTLVNKEIARAIAELNEKIQTPLAQRYPEDTSSEDARTLPDHNPSQGEATT